MRMCAIRHDGRFPSLRQAPSGSSVLYEAARPESLDALAFERAVDAAWTSTRTPRKPARKTVAGSRTHRPRRRVDARWTPRLVSVASPEDERSRLPAMKRNPIADSNRGPPPWRNRVNTWTTSSTGTSRRGTRLTPSGGAHSSSGRLPQTRSSLTRRGAGEVSRDCLNGSATTFPQLLERVSSLRVASTLIMALSGTHGRSLMETGAS